MFMFMFVASVIIQYFIMSMIMTNSPYNITNSLSKLYISVIMGLLMCIVELFSMKKHQGHSSLSLFLLFTILLGVFIYLYRTQFGVFEKEYLNEMIEHHSMAILTSKQLLNKNNKENETIILAKHIIETQEKEIDLMKKILA